MNKKFFFFLIYVFLTASIFSQEAAAADDASGDAAGEVAAATQPPPMGFIKDIRFVGLVRTSKKWLMSMFGAFIGCPVPYFQEAQLYGGLNALGLFRDIKIDLIKETDKPDSDAIIIVTVKEMWSIFGAVYGWGDDAGFVGGVAFTDMNVFGRKNIFVATGAFGADIQQGNFMFLKPPMGVKKPGVIIDVNVSHDTPYYATFRDDEISKKEMLRSGVGVSVMGICPAFMYTVGWHYSYHGWINEDIINLHINTISLSLNKGWDKNNEWFPVPRNIGVAGKFDMDWARWCRPMGELTASGTVAWPIKNYHRMMFKIAAKGGVTFDRPITMQFNRSTVRSFIAISNWATDMLGSIRGSWETGLFKTKFLTMSIFASFEGVIGRDLKIDRDSKYHLDVTARNNKVWAMGPGAGVKVYFHQMPIPVMMMGAFYNINQDKWQFGFSVGV